MTVYLPSLISVTQPLYKSSPNNRLIFVPTTAQNLMFCCKTSFPPSLLLFCNSLSHEPCLQFYYFPDIIQLICSVFNYLRHNVFSTIINFVRCPSMELIVIEYYLGVVGYLHLQEHCRVSIFHYQSRLPCVQMKVLRLIIYCPQLKLGKHNKILTFGASSSCIRRASITKFSQVAAKGGRVTLSLKEKSTRW